VCWKDKREVYVLSNTNIPPAEGNFKEDEKAVMHLIIEDYLTHMDYFDLCDRMANSHSISKKTWKWMKKLLFYLLGPTILNSYILHKSCEGNMTHLNFREQLVRCLIVLSHEEDTDIHGVPRGWPSSLETQMSQLEVKHSLHWAAKGEECAK
jgi:hypothetical protein